VPMEGWFKLRFDFYLLEVIVCSFLSYHKLYFIVEIVLFYRNELVLTGVILWKGLS
jgi:hypothetical protein